MRKPTRLVRIPAEMAQRLAVHAAAQERSVAWLAQRAVAIYLEQLDAGEPAREHSHG